MKYNVLQFMLFILQERVFLSNGFKNQWQKKNLATVQFVIESRKWSKNKP
jgi:hypothetical protein